MFIEAEPGSEIGREVRFGRANRPKRRHAPPGGGTQHGDAPEQPKAEAPETPSTAITPSVLVAPPAPRAAATVDSDDLAALRAELAAERRSRAWLESRLEELDQRLRKAQATERHAQNAAAHDQVAVLGFQASLTAEQVREADREALGLWVLEAQLHADAAESAKEIAYRSEPIHVIAEPVADARLNEKLATARMAIEAAEARAAHNAAQVRRLSEELASARVEQTRTMNRLRDLEQKLLGLEVRADLLDSIVTDRTPPSGTRDLDLPADTIAPESPQRPSLVFTETEEGAPQLAPAEEAMESLDDVASEGLTLEDFEPTPYRAPEPVQRAGTFDEMFGADATGISEVRPEPAATQDDLAGALSEFFGSEAVGASPKADDERPPVSLDIAALEDEPVGGPPRAMQHGDPLAEALSMWGQGPSVSFDVPGVTDTLQSTPSDALLSTTDDPFAGLAAALGELERPAAARLAAADDAPATEDRSAFLKEISSAGGRDDDEDPYRALSGAQGDAEAEPAESTVDTNDSGGEEPADVIAPAPDTDTNVQVDPESEIDTLVAPEAAQPPAATSGILAARGGSISTSLFDAVHRVERERREAAEAARPHLTDVVRPHEEVPVAADAAEAGDPGAPKPDKKGRANMVDALMRFMGPQ